MIDQRLFPHITAGLIIIFGISGVLTGQGVLTGGAKPAQEPSAILANRIAGGVLILVVVSLYFFFITESHRSNTFLTFLANNRKRLLQGETVSFRGREISLRTETTRFQACISFIFPWPWGMKLLSSYYAKTQPGQLRTALFCSIITALFGWLGVWTIVWLLSTLGVNFRGGHKQTVSEILSAIGEVSTSGE